jgi:hypothetical protein
LKHYLQAQEMHRLIFAALNRVFRHFPDRAAIDRGRIFAVKQHSIRVKKVNAVRGYCGRTGPWIRFEPWIRQPETAEGHRTQLRSNVAGHRHQQRVAIIFRRGLAGHAEQSEQAHDGDRQHRQRQCNFHEAKATLLGCMDAHFTAGSLWSAPSHPGW